jgi:hypothetical protein
VREMDVAVGAPATASGHVLGGPLLAVLYGAVLLAVLWSLGVLGVATAPRRRLLPEAVQWVRARRRPRAYDGPALLLLSLSLDVGLAPEGDAGDARGSFSEAYGCDAACREALLADADLLCREGFGARVPVFDFGELVPPSDSRAEKPPVEEPLRLSRHGVLAFDLDGTTVRGCGYPRVEEDAAAAMRMARQFSFAVVVITARRAPVGLPRDFEPWVQAVYYNSSGRDVPSTKAKQLLRARQLLAPSVPTGNCILFDDRPENVRAANAAGCRGVLVRCGEVNQRLILSV